MCPSKQLIFEGKIMISRISALCFVLLLTACGGGGGGGGGTSAANGLTQDANGRVGSIPANVTILPSNAQ
jgi:hypothetical protein